jgi:uncharacterized protein (TIGR02598 family)
MERIRLAPAKCPASGFSLVEVSVAMAIVSFAMVSILGLIPMGLTNFRQAMNNTVEAQIVQGITSDLELASFTSLQSTTDYYDSDGNATTASSQPVYTATVTVAAVDGSKEPVNLVNTASSVPSQMQTSADLVTISIVNNTQQKHTDVYSIIVANQNTN